MAALFTAFPINKKDGAGWVSTRINQRENFSSIYSRTDTFLSKSIWALTGILLFPFLHPIFTRYTPILSGLRRHNEEVWLNFSQTFALSFFNRNCVLVCHDLQCHCSHRFAVWLRWSERLLLNRANRVVVLSARDAKIVSRYYKVPIERIENLAAYLLPNLYPFQVKVQGPAKTLAFLGTLARKENREGLEWFVQNVLPLCPQLEVVVIGQVTPKYSIHHPRLKYLGFVEDLHATIAQHSFMIAPLFSKAGIKIKVVEALLEKTPVLGTSSAYGGLRRPCGGWCSNNALDWVKIINHGGDFEFKGVQGF